LGLLLDLPRNFAITRLPFWKSELFSFLIMTTHETVNRRYAELQSLLLATFAAEGRGIIEMLRNVEDQLSPKLAWELRSIGHIRNQVVHEGLEEIPRYFEPLCKEAAATLKQLKAKKASRVKKPKTPKASEPKASKPAKPKSAKSPAKPRITKSAKSAPAKRKPSRSRRAS
jgi:dsDNA-specific endonuclease/ATPase MutS2